MLDGVAADVFEFQGFGMLGALIAHSADQPGMTFAGQREHCEKVRFIEVHVQFTVERRAAGLHVGDVENLLVGAAGESAVQSLAHNRPGAVATRDVAGLAGFLSAIGQAQLRADAVAGFLEVFQFGIALHGDAEGFKAFDQQLLVFVLGKISMNA